VLLMSLCARVRPQGGCAVLLMSLCARVRPQGGCAMLLMSLCARVRPQGGCAVLLTSLFCLFLGKTLSVLEYLSGSCWHTFGYVQASENFPFNRSFIWQRELRHDRLAARSSLSCAIDAVVASTVIYRSGA
jgi:hypothetical protein